MCMYVCVLQFLCIFHEFHIIHLLVNQFNSAAGIAQFSLQRWSVMCHGLRNVFLFFFLHQNLASLHATVLSEAPSLHS